MQPMIKVDGKELIFSTEFLVQNEVEVSLNTDTPFGPFRASVVFHPATKEMVTGSASWSLVNDVLKFDFYGWNNPLGYCTPIPVELGTWEKGKMYFQIVNYAIGDANLARFFLLKGE